MADASGGSKPQRFKEQVYEGLAAQRDIRVLHQEVGDVEDDEFMGKGKLRK